MGVAGKRKGRLSRERVNFLNAGIIPSKTTGERRVTVLVLNRRSGSKNNNF
jgi:hypothetical protein